MSPQLRQRILEKYPKLPKFDREAILDIAQKDNKAKLNIDRAIELSLIAHIRHNYTDYDALIDEGYDPLSARHFCLERINQQLQEWQIDFQLNFEESTL
jgi:hypothetical protein